MQFMVISPLQSASTVLTVSAERLFLRATKETRVREQEAAAVVAAAAASKSKRKRGHHHQQQSQAQQAPSQSHSLKISGAQLRELCWEEYCADRRISEVGPAPAQLGCVMAAYPDGVFRGAIRVVPAVTIAGHLFDVEEDLIQPERLLVLTHYDNLEQVAVSEAPLRTAARGMMAAAAAAAQAQAAARAAATTENVAPLGVKRPRPSATASTERSPLQSRLGTPTSLPARAPRLSKYSRGEGTFATIPVAVGGEAIKDMNELLDAGVVKMDKSLVPFLCGHCIRLPIVILTMSCCGCVMCPRCAPTPPGVRDAALSERLCPACNEEPLVPPQSHPNRDEELAKLVKELSVLYLPQLKALHRRHDRTPIQDIKPAPYLMQPSPVLGSL